MNTNITKQATTAANVSRARYRQHPASAVSYREARAKPSRASRGGWRVTDGKTYPVQTRKIG